MTALAIIGVLEAVVHLLRYRSAHSPSALWSACTTGMVAALRVVFVVAGVSSLLDGLTPWAICLAYVVPATVATYAVHSFLMSRKATP